MNVSQHLSIWSSLQHCATAVIKGSDHIMLFSCDVYGLRTIITKTIIIVYPAVNVILLDY